MTVFCRQWNTVFDLQKSEQEDVDDIDYERDEFDDSSTEYEESECDISRPRLSCTGNYLDTHYNESPVHFPLVANKHDSCADDMLESQQFNKMMLNRQWINVKYHIYILLYQIIHRVMPTQTVKVNTIKW